MKQEELELLMNMPPSKFYLWLWKAGLTNKQKKFLVDKYENKSLKKDIDEVFGGKCSPS